MRKAGVVAFAFGMPGTILSNRRIAEIATKKARELNAPVYTQLDVFVGKDVRVERIKQKCIDNPPSTLRIARGAVEWAKRNDITELWIVAAKPHLWRARRDVQEVVYEKEGITEFQFPDRMIRVYGCKEVEQYSENSWFCSDSLQDKTCSREEWNKRESLIKLIPFFLYKLVAS